MSCIVFFNNPIASINLIILDFTLSNAILKKSLLSTIIFLVVKGNFWLLTGLNIITFCLSYQIIWGDKFSQYFSS